jgi:alpha-glucosidase
VTRAGSRITLGADVIGNGYPEFAREVFHLVLHGMDVDTVRIDGEDVGATDGRFVLPRAGVGFVVELDATGSN